jgi:hypothetical protein
MARRFGSAMISKTDSILLIYSTAHIRVKVYLGGGQRFQWKCIQAVCGQSTQRAIGASQASSCTRKAPARQNPVACLCVPTYRAA